MSFLHFSVFYGSVQRHGGTKRSEQLAETLNEQDVKTINPYLSYKDAFFFAIKNPVALFESAMFALYLLTFKGVSFKGMLGFFFRAVKPIVILKKNPACTLVHETGPDISLVFMQYLKWKKIPYIAVPHNIEFMVPNQNLVGFRNLASAFACEIAGYKSAKDVRVICDYDKSVLACLGIRSSTFSYYPVKSDQAEFLDIRHARDSVELANSYLLLGTVGNKPTYDGVKACLDTHKASSSQYNLIVAGYGTETFKDYESDRITVLGSIDNAKLKELLINTAALLINQPQTTGFLTKIVDFNFCGIPVLVISDYVQSDNLEKYGVYKITFSDLDTITSKASGIFFNKNPFKLR
jgi:hypothetical protein